MQKRRFLISIFSMFSLLVVLGGFTAFSYWFVLIVGCMNLLYLFNCRAYLTFFLYFIHFDVFFVVWLKYVFFGLEENSWRVLLHDDSAFSDSLDLLCVFLMVASCLTIFIRINNSRIFIKGYFDGSGLLCQKVIILIGILFLMVYLTVDFNKIVLGKIFYTQLASGFPFLELYQVLGYVLVLFFYSFRRVLIGRLLLLMYFLMAVSLFVFGFRGAIVGLLIFIFVVWVQSIRLSLFKLIVPGIAFFIVLNLVGIFRVGSAETLGVSDAVMKFGSHEANSFYTLVGLVGSGVQSEENTYLNGFINVVPLVNSFVASERVSVQLGNSILPASIMESGINMGAFSLGEAYFNYGALGSILFLSVIFLLSIFMDRKSIGVKSAAFRAIFAAQIYTFCFYGSSNYFAMVVPLVSLFIFLLVFFRAGKEVV